MITQSNNLAIVDQVAKLFFPTETLQQNVVKERLKNFLTDELFQTVLGLLSTGRTYVFNTTSIVRQTVRPGYAPKINIYNHYMDLFLGQSGNGQINDVPQIWQNNKSKIYQSAGLVYIGSLAVNGISYDIVQNQNIVGYGITYIPQINTGGASGTDPVRGGLITVTPTETGNQTGSSIQPSQSLFAGLDLNSLIIPGVILGVLYFVSQK